LFVDADFSAVGKTIGELRLRKRTSVSILSITHEGHTEINPGPDSVIQAGDVLVLLGSAEQIDQAIEEMTGTQAHVS
jgi:TrkA domain protein